MSRSKSYMIQESLTIELTDSFIQDFSQLSDKNNMLITDLINKNQDAVGIMLDPYYSDDGGRVYTPIFQHNSIDFLSKNSGVFRIEYIVNYYMGCRGLNHNDDEDMLITFMIDRKKASITLTGESKPVREPDEY